MLAACSLWCRRTNTDVVSSILQKPASTIDELVSPENVDSKAKHACSLLDSHRFPWLFSQALAAFVRDVAEAMNIPKVKPIEHMCVVFSVPYVIALAALELL